MVRNIFIVDDEEDFADITKRCLEGTGRYSVTIETDAAKAVSAIRNVKPDLVLLDLMMPGASGQEICKELRSGLMASNVPIIILSAKSDRASKVAVLEMGADDYLTKPFSIDELDARIKAVLRRSSPENGDSRMDVGGMLEIDTMRHEVKVSGRKTPVTAAEFLILALLSSNKGRVFTRAEILDYLWGDEKVVVERTVDVHIRHLREKLGKAGELIKNVRSVGYKIEG